jgi:hypothetical protein
MKYDQSLSEKLKEGPMIVHITLDAYMAARAYIGQITPSLIFSHVIHALMRIPFVTPTYSTSASVRVSPAYNRLCLEMEITAEMLPQIAAINGIDSITPPLLAVLL